MAQKILTPSQTQILKILSEDSLFQNNFYLTGGTALSEFYLHHRLSEDLDFFSFNEIDKIWLNTISAKIAKGISALKDIQESFNRNLVFFDLNGQIIKTEFTYFPMPHIEKPKLTGLLPIDSEIDIAVNKFFTIYQKPSARHFIDLFLLQKKYPWDKLEKLARIKFDTKIDPIQLGSQLIKAKEVMDMPKMLINIGENEWRDYFVQKAAEQKKAIF